MGKMRLHESCHLLIETPIKVKRKIAVAIAKKIVELMILFFFFINFSSDHCVISMPFIRKNLKFSEIDRAPFNPIALDKCSFISMS